MLEITVPDREWYNEKTGEFISVRAQTLKLEHSLISLSKWESKWKKAYLSKTTEKTFEESLDYIRCMCLTPNVDPMVFYGLGKKQIQQIHDYINDTMSATKIPKREQRKGGPKDTPTSEMIYYWMICFNIPPEYQKWHLSRLLTLIDVCEYKSEKPKPMSSDKLAHRNSALNAKRRAKSGSRG